MDIVIVGGGIVGLTLALDLHQRGIPCRVYEAAPEIKELGVGITLLPHAMREWTNLGLQDKLVAAGIQNRESRFYNRFGQLIYAEPRGRFAGLTYPEVGCHRGRLHTVLYDAARERVGAGNILTDHQCTGTEERGDKVIVHFKQTSTGKTLDDVEADVVIACDGVNSTVRRQFYPTEEPAFIGINTWRGTAIYPPILDGQTYIRAGSIRTGKIVIYPIIDNYDGKGNQLINWTTEIQMDTQIKNDWNKPGRIEDFIQIYESWTFDWCDVPDMIRHSNVIFEYPMVDKDPVDQWTFGRVTFAGDAAHPMYPRGSNGSAQGVIDARVLSEALETHQDDPVAALQAYEAQRREPTANVVRTNRQHPPDYIIIKIEELIGDRPFDNIDDVISQDELRALSENYKKVAGFTADAL